MGHQGSDAALRVTPPKDVWAQAVDGTSRSYDLTLLTVNGVPYNPGARDEVAISIAADGNDIYCAFDNAARTLNDATVVAAGGTPAYATSSAFVVPKGTVGRFMIDRTLHTLLFLKCASGQTATARVYFSSDNAYAVR